MDEETTLMGVSKLCERWGLSKQAIYNMIKREELKGVNLNEQAQANGERQRAQWRIPMEEVYRWEQEQQLEKRDSL